MGYVRIRAYTDSAGNVIKKGQIVATNVSGVVCKGEVIKDTPTFHIRLAHNSAGMGAGHISKIKSGMSILILEDKTDEEKSCPNCGQCPI